MLDFEHSSLSWRTRQGSVGRWRVAASARQGDTGERFVLAPMVMAGDVYGQGLLPLAPAYSFQIVAGRDRHVIWRDYGSTFHDTAEANSARFDRLEIDAREGTFRSITTADLIAEPPAWPLAAVIRIPQRDGPAWQLEFPIDHINHRVRGVDVEMQVETGPILVPESMLPSGLAVSVGGFTLAYAFFDRLNRLDLALLQVTGAGPAAARRFTSVLRVDGVEIDMRVRA